MGGILIAGFIIINYCHFSTLCGLSTFVEGQRYSAVNRQLYCLDS